MNHKRKAVILLATLLITGSTFAASLITDSAIIGGNLIRLGLWQQPDPELSITLDGTAIQADEVLPGDNGAQTYTVQNRGNTTGDLLFEISGVSREVEGLNLTFIRGGEEITAPLIDGAVSLGELKQNPFETEDIGLKWELSADTSADYQGSNVSFDAEFKLETNPGEPEFLIMVLSNRSDPEYHYASWGETITLTADDKQDGWGFSYWEIDGEHVFDETVEIRVHEHKQVGICYNK